MVAPGVLVMGVGDATDEIGVVEPLEVGPLGTYGNESSGEIRHAGFERPAGCLGVCHRDGSEPQDHAGPYTAKRR